MVSKKSHYGHKLRSRQGASTLHSTIVFANKQEPEKGKCGIVIALT